MNDVTYFVKCKTMHRTRDRRRSSTHELTPAALIIGNGEPPIVSHKIKLRIEKNTMSGPKTYLRD